MTSELEKKKVIPAREYYVILSVYTLFLSVYHFALAVLVYLFSVQCLLSTAFIRIDELNVRYLFTTSSIL